MIDEINKAVALLNQGEVVAIPTETVYGLATNAIVTANKDTVAIRVPSHPIALLLLNRIDFPLAAPSANSFGYISPTKASYVKSQLGDKIPFILDGGYCEKGIESTIIGFENDEPILYRVGAISIEHIEKYIGKIKLKIMQFLNLTHREC